jgi:hypothetical protein
MPNPNWRGSQITAKNYLWDDAGQEWIPQPASTGTGSDVNVTNTYLNTHNYVWDTGGLTWVAMTQPGAGGGGAVTIANGADVAEGATTDAEAAGDGSVIAILKRLRTLLSGTLAVSGPLTDAQLRASAVPISAASLPLPTGAATAANQTNGTQLVQLLDSSARDLEFLMEGDLWNAADHGLLVLGRDEDSNPDRYRQIALSPQGHQKVVLQASAVNIGDVDVLSLPATPAGDNAIGRVKLTDGTDVADVLDLTNSNPLTVAIVDGAGSQITSFGGGTQYTEDVAAAADPVGTVPILVRKDTPAGAVTTDGDNVAQRGTNFGAAFVQVVSSAGAFIDSFGGSGGTAQADRSAFTDGTTNHTPIGGVYNETGSDPTEDQAAAVRITAKRAIHVNLRDATGGEVSVGGGTQYDEDTASGAADKLTMAGVVRKDTAATLVDTDGDRTQLQVDATGRLHVNGSGVTQPVSAASLPLPTGAATETTLGTRLTETDFDTKVGALTETAPGTDTASSGLNGRLQRIAQRLTSLIGLLPAALVGGRLDVNIGASGATVPVSGTFWQATQPVSGTFWQATQPISGTVTAANTAGDVAHGTGDSGNPVKVGAKAATALPTAEAANDRVNLLADVYGRAFVRDGIQGPAGSTWAQAHEPAANTQGTTSKAADGAGRHACTGLTATFTATASAPTAVEVAVRLRDGASGAGTVLWAGKLSLPATAGASVGVTRSGLWIVGTANTAMTLEFSAAGGANTTEVVSLEGVTLAE